LVSQNHSFYKDIMTNLAKVRRWIFAST